MASSPSLRYLRMTPNNTKAKPLKLKLPKLHPKQRLAFNTEATEVLYGGATRGGKTFLTKYSLIRWCYEIPGLQCVIYRLNFDDVVTNYMKGADGFNALLAPWIEKGLVSITKTEVRFNFNGSLIELRHCADERAQNKGQGNPIHVLVFEEAAQILEDNMRFLRGWVTMDEEMKSRVPDKWKGRFPKIIYTSNPFGQSAGYFRRGFVKAAAPMTVFQAPIEDGGFSRIYIPAKVEDNPSEDREAVIRRVSGIGDEALSDALLNENWDAPVGDFLRQWNDNTHKVRDFTPPEWWFKFRGFDWGSSEPFYVAWACVSDGEPFVDNYGRERWFPRGAIIIYREWNGCDPNDHSQGLGMSNVDIAKGIVELTTEVTSNITITDSLPFQYRGAELMAETFARHGVPLTQGNTARIVGWGRLKEYLTGKDGWPLFYVQDCCPFMCEYIPVLQRHNRKPEDAQEEGEATHSCDVARLIVMTRPPVKMKPVYNSGLVEHKKAPIMTARGALKQLKRRAGGRH